MFTNEIFQCAETHLDVILFTYFISLQAQAGRILYWGAQGIKRNLEAAYEYYKMGAETEDPQAMYDYGVVLMRVRNERSLQFVIICKYTLLAKQLSKAQSSE